MPVGKPTPPDARKLRPAKRVVLAKARPDPLQGRVILNRFRVTSKIARGGMASIYLAIDVKDGGSYAVKVLRRDMVLDPSARMRLLNECRAIQRICHPNVVRIHDLGETDDGRVFLVMDYVDGVCLREVINKGPVPPIDLIHIARAISLGLAAAHEQCIIHRDLKPENVLVKKRRRRERSSQVEEIRLVDFGIARIIDAPRITTTKHIMGTPQYIAPEQAMGRHVDNRVDVYGLGVMMYEMLTGELPFPGEDPEILLRQHISIPPPPLSVHDVSEDTPYELKQLIMRCLAKSPKNRPGSIEDVIVALDKISY